MQDKNGKIRKDNTDTRRAELIAATLRIIARDGVKAATVRQITQEANVTQGLVRYYFQSKDELIAAAYESYMSGLVRAADDASKGEGGASERLAKFIEASLQAPVTGRDTVAIWAGFFELLLHDEAMIASHKRGYDSLRLHLKSLIADVLAEQGRSATEAELRRLSIAGNAILDGLWMEGGALPEAFHDGELVLVGLESFGALLKTDLCSFQKSLPRS
ncbi:TetR/AcrR family transcriptional regulator [Roseibium sp. SCP14]|uniref:TetR/AcrR family transcriptional regulator n=1 Tax=Roseibium sp. SCP14 TaxID=3141375 RepID=UPI00333B7A82